jgi:hypothetical protein
MKNLLIIASLVGACGSAPTERIIQRTEVVETIETIEVTTHLAVQSDGEMLGWLTSAEGSILRVLLVEGYMVSINDSTGFVASPDVSTFYTAGCGEEEWLRISSASAAVCNPAARPEINGRGGDAEGWTEPAELLLIGESASVMELYYYNPGTTMCTEDSNSCAHSITSYTGATSYALPIEVVAHES